jgi:hypothetical protein
MLLTVRNVVIVSCRDQLSALASEATMRPSRLRQDQSVWGSGLVRNSMLWATGKRALPDDVFILGSLHLMGLLPSAPAKVLR